jgi:hypothetical protein
MVSGRDERGNGGRGSFIVGGREPATIAAGKFVVIMAGTKIAFDEPLSTPFAFVSCAFVRFVRCSFSGDAS